MLQQNKITLLFGVMITLVSLTNLIPIAIVDSNGMRLLFGIFQVSAPLVILHLITGLSAINVASFTKFSALYLRIFGILYALLAVTGFIQGDVALGLLPVNMADNLLHTLFALTLLGVGFGLKPSTANQ